MEMIQLADTQILFWIQNHLVYSQLTPVMIGVSYLEYLWVAIGIGLILRPATRRLGYILFAALIGSVIIGPGVLKHLVMRVRPCFVYPDVMTAVQVASASDYSFPSGHSLASFASAAVLYAGLGRRYGIAALITAGAVAFSRLYLFVHYPIDVLAGAVLGVSIGSVVWQVSKRLGNRFRQLFTVQQGRIRHE